MGETPKCIALPKYRHFAATATLALGRTVACTVQLLVLSNFCLVQNTLLNLPLASAVRSGASALWCGGEPLCHAVHDVPYARTPVARLQGAAACRGAAQPSQHQRRLLALLVCAGSAAGAHAQVGWVGAAAEAQGGGENALL